jgi:phosphate-selective porin OprO and OprP
MRNSVNSLRAVGLLAALTASALTPLAAQTTANSELDSLREQIRLLDQKLRSLERNLELKDEAATADAKKQPKLTVSDGRIEVVSADGANSLRLRGLVQADARFYLDAANAAQDGFVLRRARLIFEGKFSDIFEYVVQPEFGGTLQILDANINAVIAPEFQVRVGRFKTPIGLEQLQSDPVAFFNERSIATNLTPNRDVGVQVHGDVLAKRLNYAVGVFNGVLDGGNSPTTNLNNEGDFTVAARLFATPFANNKDSALKGLGFGLAAGTGNYKAGVPLNGYRTDGQQTFLAYRSTTVANGKATTFSPQAYYYHGPLGILAEYVSSSVELANGANAREVTNQAYNLSVGYVLTGEDSSYKGVTPKTKFSPSAGTWGAFEVVGRVAHVDIDDDAFVGGATSLAAAATNASEVTSYGVGLNWYLSKTVRANFDVFQSKFDFQGARPVTGALSDDELAFITRLQVSF